MGSLPNLHELEQIERKRERRREREQLREQLHEQRARDSSKERERFALLAHRKQSSYNAYLMAGLGMSAGGGALGMAAAAGAAHLSSATAGASAGAGAGVGSSAATGGATGPTTATTTLGGMAVGGAALLGIGGAPNLLGGISSKHYQQHHQPQQQPQHHSHHLQHRHSLTTRHRVLRTRSSGATHNIWDEQMLEHLAAYSPISTRSHRINPVSSYQVQQALAASRRRESINSSIGATSIRRLITLNNRNCRHKVPTHVRRKVCKSFTLFTIAHGLMCAVLVPLLGLQASNSIWHHREQWLHVGPNIGSILTGGMCLLSAAMTLLITRLIRRFGYTLLVAANYVAVTLFLLCHLYPSIYTLLPAYLLLGVTLSPSWISKIALVVHFGSKLSCSQHECTLTTSHGMDAMDEHMLFCNRDQRVRRLARWFHAAQNLGIIVGAVVASVALACTSTDWNCYEFGTKSSSATTAIPTTNTATPTTLAPPIIANISSRASDIEDLLPSAAGLKGLSLYSMPNFWPHIAGYFDDFYNLNEHGNRICGADMCPVWRLGVRRDRTSTIDEGANETIYAHFINGKSSAGGFILIGIYIIFSIASMVLSLLTGKIQGTFRHERIKGITDTLLFAGPMAYFIGTEQAYMLSDFLRAFVSCSLGISMVSGALIGMGIMQTIVSCTLSMLLRHVKRIVVILAAFFFHSCLLLALSSWKPIQDDTALFYVLAASWGACNGIWETLIMTLVTLNHPNHIAEVAAPLQGFRFLALGVTFAAHGLMCETPKIIILVIILVVSVPPYAMLEIRLETQRKAHLVNL